MSLKRAQSIPHGLSSAGASNSLLQRSHAAVNPIPVQRELAQPASRNTQPASELVRDVTATPGQPLDNATRSLMEPHLGYDLSRVRVHNDQRAAESAQALHAKAYTAGTHVVFDQGGYAPATPQGQRLLVHELTHVAQQASGPVAGTEMEGGISVSHPHDAFEEAAAHNAEAFSSGTMPTSQTGRLQSLPTFSAAGPGPIQCSAGDDWAPPSGIAGIAGAVFGAASMGLAARQLAIAQRPPASASTSGGVSVNNISFNTLGQAAAGSDESSVDAAPTITKDKILTVEAPNTGDQSNSIAIGLLLRTDGHNIIDAVTQEQSVEGYAGGSDGPSATVSFTATQTKPLSITYHQTTSAPKDSWPAKPDPDAAPDPSPVTIEKKKKVEAKKEEKKGDKKNEQKKEEEKKPGDVAEVRLRFTGINNVPADVGWLSTTPAKVQRFKGAFTVTGKGDVRVEAGESAVTQGDGLDMLNGGDRIAVGFGTGRKLSPKMDSMWATQTKERWAARLNSRIQHELNKKDNEKKDVGPIVSAIRDMALSARAEYKKQHYDPKKSDDPLTQLCQKLTATEVKQIDAAFNYPYE